MARVYASEKCGAVAAVVFNAPLGIYRVTIAQSLIWAEVS
jgi:hypothetical protein